MSPQSSKITLLIPAFNEATRIGVVLTKVTQLSWLDQIYVIDDASTDETAQVVQAKFPQVKLLQLKQNLGKATALKLGLDQVATDWLLLLDADLWGFKAQDLTTAWEKLQTRPDLSQLILALTTDPTIWKSLKLNIIMSGQRFVRTTALKTFFDENQPQNYDLEILFTHWCLNHDLKIGWLPFKVSNYSKLQKWPWWQAVPKSLSFYGKWLQPQNLRLLISQMIRLTNQL